MDQRPGENVNGSNYQRSLLDYNVDVVFCIDATASMGALSGNLLKTRTINRVKKRALEFCGDLARIMNNRGQNLEQIRARVIVFRDYLSDGNEAMLLTDFFLLPQQAAEFEDCINCIRAKGGETDIPANGLEALAYAIRSDWVKTGRRRHVIVLWTDAPAHELDHGHSAPNYPNGMPRSLAELNGWWEQMNFVAKRLILFAPDEGPWSRISENWDNVAHFPSVAGDGLFAQNYRELVGCITNDI